MRLKPLIRRASFALALAITGCTVTTSPDACSGDSTVTGCLGDSTGYSCTGTATPDETNSGLLCSTGTPGNSGSTLYCCVEFGPGSTQTSCKPDVTVAGCPSGAQGYSCTSTDTPSQTDASLHCGQGAPGNAGSQVYCCSTAGAGGEVDGGGDVASEATVGAEAATEGAAAEAASDDGGNDASGADETAADAGGDGGTCSVTSDTGNATCDQCVESTCCSALVACGSADDAGVDDAGATACEQLVQCTLDCLAGKPDAGLAPGTLLSCAGLCAPIYSAAEQASAAALLGCVQTGCTQQCL